VPLHYTYIPLLYIVLVAYQESNGSEIISVSRKTDLNPVISQHEETRQVGEKGLKYKVNRPITRRKSSID